MAYSVHGIGEQHGDRAEHILYRFAITNHGRRTLSDVTALCSAVNVTINIPTNINITTINNISNLFPNSRPANCVTPNP
jgi:hypothetical protein